MISIIKAITGLSVLALVGAVPAYSKDAPHATCPQGYAPLGAICVSAADGDIVLPVSKQADASEQASADR